MAYITIDKLGEAFEGDLNSTDYFMISTADNSYKVTLDTLTAVLIGLTSGAYQEITNAVINDITNTVNANSVHLEVLPTQNILKGTPVTVVIDNTSNIVKVAAATADDVVIGLAEYDLTLGIPGAVMALGILDSVDTLAYNEGDVLFYQDGAVTAAPVSGLRKQVIGIVLNKAGSGKLLIMKSESDPVAVDIGYVNSTSGLTASEVQAAIDEIVVRVIALEKRSFVQATAPTLQEGASEGDSWYDTVNETFNIYREDSLNPGTFNWGPLIFHSDIIDGGTWNPLPSITMTSIGNGSPIELDGTGVLSGTYDAAFSAITAITGTWVTDAITFNLTDNLDGTWSASGLENGAPTYDVAQSLDITITTADGDSATTTYTGITPSEPAVVFDYTVSMGANGANANQVLVSDFNPGANEMRIAVAWGDDLVGTLTPGIVPDSFIITWTGETTPALTGSFDVLNDGWVDDIAGTWGTSMGAIDTDGGNGLYGEPFGLVFEMTVGATTVTKTYTGIWAEGWY